MKRALLIIILIAAIIMPTAARATVDFNWRTVTLFSGFLATAQCTPNNCNDGSACETYGNQPYCVGGGCSAQRTCQITLGVCQVGWPPPSCWKAQCVANTEANCGSSSGE